MYGNTNVCLKAYVKACRHAGAHHHQLHADLRRGGHFREPDGHRLHRGHHRSPSTAPRRRASRWLRNADHGNSADRSHDGPDRRHTPGGIGASATSFTVTAPAMSITVTAPPAGGSYAQQDAASRSPGRPEGRSPAASSPSGQTAAAAGTSASSCPTTARPAYSTSVTLDVPVGASYRIVVGYRPTVGNGAFTRVRLQPRPVRCHGGRLQSLRHRPAVRGQLRPADQPAGLLDDRRGGLQRRVRRLGRQRQRLVHRQARAQQRHGCLLHQRHPRRAGRLQLPHRRRLPAHGGQRRLHRRSPTAPARSLSRRPSSISP